ncbi:MAG: hypothetical protein IPL19_22770 [Sandaracinaceae bacterium]|nr:hypothetical protein [Sandaracinaceae bacterium]MBK7774691.1 hypothetical protein [Sandaracinaceae bacterium]MBK8410780.1 hypothetical protein [Sandaracinaceae bacterium]
MTQKSIYSVVMWDTYVKRAPSKTSFALLVALVAGCSGDEGPRPLAGDPSLPNEVVSHVDVGPTNVVVPPEAGSEATEPADTAEAEPSQLTLTQGANLRTIYEEVLQGCGRNGCSPQATSALRRADIHMSVAVDSGLIQHYRFSERTLPCYVSDSNRERGDNHELHIACDLEVTHVSPPPADEGARVAAAPDVQAECRTSDGRAILDVADIAFSTDLSASPLDAPVLATASNVMRCWLHGGEQLFIELKRQRRSTSFDGYGYGY